MLKDYFFLAIGNLRHRGLRSWLTMLGIFIGIAAVVSLISLGQGLQEAITGQFSTLDPDKLIIENAGTGFGPPGSTSVKKLTEHDLNLIKSISGVEFAIPRLIRSVKVDLDDEREFIFTTSIPDGKKQIEIIEDALNLEIGEGRFLELEDRGKIVVGIHLKEDHFNGKLKAGKDIKIQGRNFEVIGILKKSSNFIVNNVILMPEDDLKEILEIEDEIDIIVVQVEDKDKTEEVAQDIERKLRKDRKQKLGEEDFSVQTPLQAIGTINNILNIINLVVIGIAALSLLVGGIGIANAMYTSTLERTKDIGIMKSVGAKNSDILFIFLIESSLLGLVGGIIGAILGLGLAFLVSSIVGSFLGGISLEVRLSFPLLVLAISFSLLIGITSGILPALQASKLNPVDALRQ
ncbi:MAG: ABC transporter permease [Nanoarchaeota archaeon]|nr:ABC transporter permease [Nanoarchaeota archaeon]